MTRQTKSVVLLGVTSKAEVHARLKTALGFPDYYGKNLDASDECLQDYCGGTCIIISGLQSLEVPLRNYVGEIIDIMEEFRAADDSDFEVRIE